MTNSCFRELRNEIYSFNRNFHFISDKLVSVELNNKVYSCATGTKKTKLSPKQLEYFTYISDFRVNKPINM